MSNKNKIIFTSALTIAICLAIVTGSTLALFSGEAKMNVAVTAGELKVTATPIDGDDGDNDVDFETATTIPGKLPMVVPTASGNTIGLSNMVPGDSVTFKVRVDNSGTIATECKVMIEQEPLTYTDDPDLSAEENEENAKKINLLWEALAVTVEQTTIDKEGNETTLTLAKEQKLFDENSSDPAKIILAEGVELAALTSATYTITIAFPTTDNDDAYKGAVCCFNYSIFATQYNEPQNP